MEEICDQANASDHCRIGSLESTSFRMTCKAVDHCRIGSLENCDCLEHLHPSDHCRIGSLENDNSADNSAEVDHCRIGSLETVVSIWRRPLRRSLPHRQLRKLTEEEEKEIQEITAA